MKRFFVVVGLFVIFLIVSVLFVSVRETKEGLTVSKVKIGLAAFDVEVADTAFLQTKGLSGRESLPKNYGMLFIFDDLQKRSFWMKDVQFPLDFVWIRDNKVVGMVYGAEPEVGDNLTIYESPELVDMVLEVNAGELTNYGIKIGDAVIINF
ncbi:MAG: hypothetical protein A3I24_03920 [Candidatus Harrisonbacteria bacterium RIFCSPLOWO2_02_FULL_41_13b]|uniref:DUF192 domain-containing protein n=1 Tax=Candidatus Harrisonbacteria bacterium RIFCSPLOWO2_02_FULL_41_13b TaxID=1798409 RepID=A0A1G1ZSS5_9BACT|nr:MAG: hypothetical protein A3J53_00130 [Candidatus Harrisonbacteria bacterium RIFCSPHIGHO2_02_FULL_40_20]OGY66810.1 MAG: hypothetical protein A3I24_03920 [Candidatus Harrisonbacteria bacterium RIFCSPLOWO2_02_FULL_41_13b]